MRRWAFALALVATAPAWASPPLSESATGRRAVRGAPVDVGHESEELRQLREFDEQSFPASFPGPLWVARPSDEGGAPPRPGGSEAIGPDTLPTALRSPDREMVKPIEPPPTTAIPWLDQLKMPDLPVRLDPRVVRYLEFYKNDRRGRAIMGSWLKKQGRWKALFSDALRAAHLPLALIYVSMIESGYDPLDHSHAGAVGLWQFMPDNGRIYGLRTDYWVDERRNPEKATAAWMHYISDLKERFGGWPMTLAAFNAGYGAVLRAMQKYNTNDYWELCKHEDGLPWETTLYVPKAMAAAIVGENRALFGYDSGASDLAYSFDRASVPTSTSLAAIARAAGVSQAELAALNPELRRNRTPPEPWEVRLPPGSGPRFAAAFEQHREMVKPFIVRFGERLDDVAAAAGISAHELRLLNGVEDSSEIRPGLTLLVPEGHRPLPSPSACDTVIVAVPDKDAAVSGRKRVFYRTLSQDTVADVAAFFKVKPIDLTKWNNLDLDAKLTGNMVLQLWVAPEFDVGRAALLDPAHVRVVTTGSSEFFDLVEARRGRKRLTYLVKHGDDLKKIGKRFNLTVADLERINRFSAAHTDLTVGQKLTVYVAMSPSEKSKAACGLTPGGLEPAAPALPVVGGELERARQALEKEPLDTAKEPTSPDDPVADEERTGDEERAARPAAEPNSGSSTSPTTEPQSRGGAGPIAGPKSGHGAGLLAEPKSGGTSLTMEPKSGRGAGPMTEPRSGRNAGPVGEPRSGSDGESVSDPKSGGMPPSISAPRNKSAGRAITEPKNSTAEPKNSTAEPKNSTAGLTTGPKSRSSARPASEPKGGASARPSGEPNGGSPGEPKRASNDLDASTLPPLPRPPPPDGRP